MVNSMKDNSPRGVVVEVWMEEERGGMARHMLTISTSQSLREKQALGDSADRARKTDPKKGKAQCVRMCVCM